MITIDGMEYIKASGDLIDSRQTDIEIALDFADLRSKLRRNIISPVTRRSARLNMTMIVCRGVGNGIIRYGSITAQRLLWLS